MNLTNARSFLIPLAKCDKSKVTSKSAIEYNKRCTFLLLVRSDIYCCNVYSLIDRDIENSFRNGGVISALESIESGPYFFLECNVMNHKFEIFFEVCNFWRSLPR